MLLLIFQMLNVIKEHILQGIASDENLLCFKVLLKAGFLKWRRWRQLWRATWFGVGLKNTRRILQN